ncbi:MAG: cupin domain-containing protein [Chlorobiaceae bacterium]|nr:cupin domain-containing protein [Chlorobiales bacterium]NTU90329.1 cupin domain-containing protein [Chlorobiaceae bacterium]
MRHIPIILALFGILLPGNCLADGYANLQVEKLLVSSTSYNGQNLSYPETDKPEVTVAVVTFPPGSSTGWHEHPVPVYAYLLEGEITVELQDGTHHQFHKGEPIVEVTNLQHNGRNTGKTDTRMVVFYTGAVGTPNVIRPETATIPGQTKP